VLLTDPGYLADIYSSTDDVAVYVRTHGVVVMDFGGDCAGPVWYQFPYVLLPISMHLSDADKRAPAGVTVWGEVGCDSGSFVFLPLATDLPSALRDIVDGVLARQLGALLPLPAGKWQIWYEQWDAPANRPPTWYRNIVVAWECV
jgi:hypothetical protein